MGDLCCALWFGWVYSNLVGGFNPSEKYESHLGLFSQYMEK
jgi:hypothetical protein